MNSSFFPQENLHEQLALGLLAGNVFDWGAKEVALLMESGTGLRFEDALKFVNPRPWLVDSLGGFQLEFVSISRVINRMTCYNSSALIGGKFILKKSFTRFALQSECCNFNQ